MMTILTTESKRNFAGDRVRGTGGDRARDAKPLGLEL